MGDLHLVAALNLALSKTWGPEPDYYKASRLMWKALVLTLGKND